MPILGLVIFITCLLAYLRRRQTRHQKERDDAFWAREEEANHTRRKDISLLPYLTVPLDRLPLGKHESEELSDDEKLIRSIAGRKILNLGTATNTDLKLEYGPANLTELTNCEQNFVALCRALVNYATHLLKAGYRSDALDVLEVGISCGSDLSQNYLMLADLYVEMRRVDSIHALIDHAESLDSLMKNSIISGLNERLASIQGADAIAKSEIPSLPLNSQS